LHHNLYEDLIDEELLVYEKMLQNAEMQLMSREAIKNVMKVSHMKFSIPWHTIEEEDTWLDGSDIIL